MMQLRPLASICISCTFLLFLGDMTTNRVHIKCCSTPKEPRQLHPNLATVFALLVLALWDVWPQIVQVLFSPFPRSQGEYTKSWLLYLLYFPWLLGWHNYKKYSSLLLLCHPRNQVKYVKIWLLYLPYFPCLLVLCEKSKAYILIVVMSSRNKDMYTITIVSLAPWIAQLPIVHFLTAVMPPKGPGQVHWNIATIIALLSLSPWAMWEQ